MEDEGIKALLREAKVAGLITGWYTHLRARPDKSAVTGVRLEQGFTINPANNTSRVMSRDEAIDYCLSVAALLTPTPDSL